MLFGVFGDITKILLVNQNLNTGRLSTHSALIHYSTSFSCELARNQLSTSNIFNSPISLEPLTETLAEEYVHTTMKTNEFVRSMENFSQPSFDAIHKYPGRLKKLHQSPPKITNTLFVSNAPQDHRILQAMCAAALLRPLEAYGNTQADMLLPQCSGHSNCLENRQLSHDTDLESLFDLISTHNHTYEDQYSWDRFLVGSYFLPPTDTNFSISYLRTSPGKACLAYITLPSKDIASMLMIKLHNYKYQGNFIRLAFSNANNIK